MGNWYKFDVGCGNRMEFDSKKIKSSRMFSLFKDDAFLCVA